MKHARTVLANEKQLAVAVSVGPEPAFTAVIAGTVFIAGGNVPERHANVFAREPLPTSGTVARKAHPILAVIALTGK